MLQQQALDHFERAGWRVQPGSEPAEEAPSFRPDFLVQRGAVTQAVLVREDPPGPFALGIFAAYCRARRIRGVLVCPDDAAVRELCDQQGLDVFPAEALAEVVVMGRPSPPSPVALPPQPSRAALPVSLSETVPNPRAAGSGSWRRWAVVALIWAAALGVSLYDVLRWVSR